MRLQETSAIERRRSTIRANYALGLPVKAIAVDLGVAQSYVSRTCNQAGLRRRTRTK